MALNVPKKYPPSYCRSEPPNRLSANAGSSDLLTGKACMLEIGDIGMIQGMNAY
ncbi:hypothetical protein D8I24_4392 [Cupriavidus necator H850]|nr:hypothetical protein D8I24_4392 [Cupriavidus necator H850]